jgi:hypothetical protein
MAASRSNGKRLDSSKVLEYVKKHKNFSTAEIAKVFRAKHLQAAAAIAILRIKEVVDHGPKASSSSSDQSSRWVYTG